MGKRQLPRPNHGLEQPPEVDRDALRDEMVSLAGVRRALRANAVKAREEGKPGEAAGFFIQAEGYNDRINALIDEFFDGEEAA